MGRHLIIFQKSKAASSTIWLINIWLAECVDSKSLVVNVKLALCHLMRLLYFNKGLVFFLHSLTTVCLFCHIQSNLLSSENTFSSVSCDRALSKLVFPIWCQLSDCIKESRSFKINLENFPIDRLSHLVTGSCSPSATDSELFVLCTFDLSENG